MNIKTKLHKRNLHNTSYDFEQLIQSLPSLKAFVKPNKYGNLSIDFSNEEAVLQLNKALLRHFYDIQWSIPKGYLCPPIPGRADYIHYLADLLAQSNQGKIPKNDYIKGIDIGIGANGIYSILGHQLYGWHFLGSDINKTSLDNVHTIIEQNDSLKGAICLKHQNNAKDIFNGLICENDNYTFTLCNPPFHKSQKEATKGSLRKLNNLNKTKQAQLKLNFAGQSNELWCQGGEVVFIKNMIEQSVSYQKNVLWFTSLVSKKEHLTPLYQMLKKVQAKEVKTIQMTQGQKTSRFIAWSFFDAPAQKEWFLTKKESHARK